MEEQLQFTLFDPRLPPFLGRIRDIARREKGDRLTAALEDLVISGADELGDIRQRLIVDLRLSDYVLMDLGEALASKLIRGRTKRKYALITKCGKCSDSPRQKISESSKLRQEVDVGSYLHESQMADCTALPALNTAGFKDTCGRCGTPLEITSTSNLVMPVSDELLFLIAQRVKSAGRYCEKLVDLIFYDKNDSRTTKRSIIDRYAFAVVANFPNGMNEKQFRRNFRNQFEMAIPDNGDFEDAVCYAFLDVLKGKFEVDMTRMQDNIKSPKERVKNGRVEQYKILQFPLSYHGKRFEGQIKTRATYLREQDRKSAIGHETYVEKERQLRNNMFKDIPEARIVYNLLMKLFSDRKEC
jgi:hypothetical protein